MRVMQFEAHIYDRSSRAAQSIMQAPRLFSEKNRCVNISELSGMANKKKAFSIRMLALTQISTFSYAQQGSCCVLYAVILSNSFIGPTIIVSK